MTCGLIRLSSATMNSNEHLNIGNPDVSKNRFDLRVLLEKISHVLPGLCEVHINKAGPI